MRRLRSFCHRSRNPREIPSRVNLTGGAGVPMDELPSGMALAREVLQTDYRTGEDRRVTEARRLVLDRTQHAHEGVGVKGGHGVNDPHLLTLD